MKLNRSPRLFLPTWWSNMRICSLRCTVNSYRNPVIQKIEEARKKHFKSLNYVKAYINEKFAKEMAVRYFPELDNNE